MYPGISVTLTPDGLVSLILFYIYCIQTGSVLLRAQDVENK